ncbi:DUF4352 domain-containing protein [Salinibacterium sp. dk2585]|uniref:DUF4352 domain-containing protein n=1 Tax=unclassified Salinibacterium TaxID=2632331 RepID=UPI0011C24A80|nr:MULTISPECIES: DUF4352 domain-containing protein [unclassified Salinibacterium]QEE60495.1 DUF4352 domain-containing protein [Salinibacterium sp. dk2585]TXK55567.1 DUF4352 domain-containing protein [Salinibacterium sp. dk5596]
MADTKPAEETRPDGARRRLLFAIAAAAAIVLGLGLVALYLAVGQEEGRETPGMQTPGASSTPSATPSSTPVERDADGGTPPADDAAEEVPVGEQVELGAGVTAEVTDVVPFAAEGRGVGETSGPALRFVLVVTNGSGNPISLDGASVNLYYGDDTTPASPLLNDESADPLGGELAPAGTARGTYIFSVPEDQHDSYRLEFSHAAGSGRVLFRP